MYSKSLQCKVFTPKHRFFRCPSHNIRPRQLYPTIATYSADRRSCYDSHHSYSGETQFRRLIHSRTSPKPSSKVPKMSLTESFTSSPSSWSSSQSLLSVSRNTTSTMVSFIRSYWPPSALRFPVKPPPFQSRSRSVANVGVPPSFHLLGTSKAYNNYARVKLLPGSTVGAVPEAHHRDGVTGALGIGQQKTSAIRTFNTF